MSGHKYTILETGPLTPVFLVALMPDISIFKDTLHFSARLWAWLDFVPVMLVFGTKIFKLN